MVSSHNSKFIIHNSADDLHHVYIIAGNVEQNKQQLFEFFREKLDFDPIGNPDFFFEDTGTESFGVDEAHRLKERQSHTGIGERKIFVVQTERLTAEAQNALLKVCEDPTPHTHIFILVPDAAHILPTLRSRAMLIAETGEEVSAVDPKEFLSMDPAKRLTAVEAFIKAKNKEGARVFLNALEKEIAGSGAHKEKSEYADALATILESKQYLSQRSPSIKIILEHLALTAPVSDGSKS